MPRCVIFCGGVPYLTPCWYFGNRNWLLIPPPVAPLTLSPSFHTISLLIFVRDATSFVPPHANANGLLAGNSTCGTPSRDFAGRSDDPWSPASQHTVTPNAASSC